MFRLFFKKLFRRKKDLSEAFKDAPLKLPDYASYIEIASFFVNLDKGRVLVAREVLSNSFDHYFDSRTKVKEDYLTVIRNIALELNGADLAIIEAHHRVTTASRSYFFWETYGLNQVK